MKLLYLLIAVGTLLVDSPSYAATSYSYDSLNRLTGVDYGNGTTVSYSYDAAGNMTAKQVSAPVSADLAIGKTHRGNFFRGQSGASYQIVVSNVGATATDGSLVSVTDTLPTGLTASGLSGSGWNCTVATLTCTRSDGLAAGQSYPPLTLTVNVAANAAATLTNTAQVAGGGDGNGSNNTASDPTTINVTASTNANLANLVLSTGTLSPAFASGTLSYNASVVSNTLTITPTVADAAAAVKVNGISVVSGSPSGPITLSAGSNPIPVLVTAQDGVTTQGYSVNVNYLPLASCTYALSPADLSNTAAAGGTRTITVTTPAGCPVSATSYQPWVTVTTVTPNGGTTTVTLQVNANAGATRATSLVVAGRLYLITQPGP